jgi:uncharacterized protein YigA (DUF484 family)
MSSETRKSSEKTATDVPLRADLEQEVVDYLGQNPDFFIHHPHLLLELDVPHDCGPAASLIEHQARVLKKQNSDLTRRFKELMDNAHLNEELSQRIHLLVLALVHARDLDECLGALYQGMTENFGADMISVRIFAEAREVSNKGLGEFVTRDDCDLFQSVFTEGNPVCGQATSSQLEFLFQDQASSVGSTALVPIRVGYEQDALDQPPARVLMAIGSRDATRFQPGMGTVYLRQLADLLGQILHRHVM